MRKKILFVVNIDWFFLSHRLPIALEALKQGYQVHLVTEITDKHKELEGYGFIVHPIVFNRGALSLSGEFLIFMRLWKLFKLIKPDIVHLVTIKPVLLGGLAARISGQKAVVAAVSGLGLVFTTSGLWGLVRRWVAGNVYKLVFKHPNLKVIFQNSDDKERMVKITGLSDGKLELIHGSGVDLSEYVHRPLPGGVPIVIFAARFLGDKGIREFTQAAILLKQQGIRARFCLVGSVDVANPNSVTNEDLMKWSREGAIELWGQRRDMPEVISSASLVVLPSYYGEGLPKVLIEASACGRAVVTTDHPGCRDAIIPNVTGLLVPIRNSNALASAMQYLLSNTTICQSMGERGRLLAESKFDVAHVVAAHLRIYHELIQAT